MKTILNIKFGISNYNKLIKSLASGIVSGEDETARNHYWANENYSQLTLWVQSMFSVFTNSSKQVENCVIWYNFLVAYRNYNNNNISS